MDTKLLVWQIQRSRKVHTNKQLLNYCKVTELIVSPCCGLSLSSFILLDSKSYKIFLFNSDTFTRLSPTQLDSVAMSFMTQRSRLFQAISSEGTNPRYYPFSFFPSLCTFFPSLYFNISTYLFNIHHVHGTLMYKCDICLCFNHNIIIFHSCYARGMRRCNLTKRQSPLGTILSLLFS